MNKTWNVTLYRNGKPVSERHGVSEYDAIAQIYRLSRTSASLETVEQALPVETGELSLAA